jgi:hypothetical protein
MSDREAKIRRPTVALNRRGRAVFVRLESEKRRVPRDLRMRESTALIRFGRGNDAETVFDGPA